MIARDLYLKKIRPFIDTPVVKVLTGIRRCGKTVMLDLIKNELTGKGINDETDILSVNFESGALDYLKSVDLSYAYIKNAAGKIRRKLYLFLDEVQELPGWEKLVNSCLIDFNVDVYMTGSNAKLLSGELATYLGGRYVEFRIHPFSYREVLDAYKAAGRTFDPKEVFSEFLVLGGMPFLYQYEFDVKSAKQYLGDVFNSIILKDIAQRNKVRDIDQLRRLIQYFLANIGNSFSAASLVNYLKNEKRKLSTETLYNYVSYCKDACLLHLVSREDIQGKKLLSFQEKIYLTDHGIREAVLGNNQRDINQVLENIVFMELVRNDFDVTIGREGKKEVDFIAKRGGKKAYFQVTYLLADESTIEREFSALRSIPDNYPKYVLSLDEFDLSRDGIIHRNIRDFLLGDDLR